MANYSKIADMLNDSLIPSVMGKGAYNETTNPDGYKVLPDLSNIVDFGKTLNTANLDDLKNYTNTFICDVINKFVVKDYEPERILEIIPYEEFYGVKQSIMTDFIKPEDTEIVSLVNNKKYDSFNTWRDTTFNVKIFNRSKGYRFTSKISIEMFKEAFTSAKNLGSLTAMIVKSVQNSIKNTESTDEHNILAGVVCVGKKFNLVAEFNSLVSAGFGYTEIIGEISDGETTPKFRKGKPNQVTAANCLYNEVFCIWAKRVIMSIVGRSKIVSNAFNDGSINNWTKNSTIVANRIFAEMTGLNCDKIVDFWNMTKPLNNDGTIATPTINDEYTTAYNVLSDESGEKLSGSIECKSAVAVIWADDAVIRTVRPVPNRTVLNEDGQFMTTFYDYISECAIDTRENIITFVLEDPEITE